jgi:integrase
MPKIPQEAKINYIIANASPKLRTAISISKETGLRPIELMRLKLRDIDLQKRAVYPETAKHGNPRVLKITEKTLHMLTEYLARANIKLNQKIFANWKPVDYSKYFRATRNKTAKKMADPTIKTIRLYDLRHFFATMPIPQNQRHPIRKTTTRTQKHRNNPNLHTTTPIRKRR